jgi:hypothetical protein
MAAWWLVWMMHEPAGTVAAADGALGVDRESNGQEKKATWPN